MYKPCEAKRSELSQTFEGRVGDFKRETLVGCGCRAALLELLRGSNLRRGTFLRLQGLQSSRLGAGTGLGLIGSTSRDWGGGAGGTSVSDCGTFLGLLVFFDQLAALLTPSSAQLTPSPRRAGTTKKNGLYFVLYELYCTAYVA